MKVLPLDVIAGPSFGDIFSNFNPISTTFVILIAGALVIIALVLIVKLIKKSRHKGRS